MNRWFSDFIEVGEALLEEDDFEDRHVVIMWCKEGGVIGLEFDICDIRTICLLCGNGIDCCTC
jgi:hypothetical protein